MLSGSTGSSVGALAGEEVGEAGDSVGRQRSPERNLALDELEEESEDSMA